MNTITSLTATPPTYGEIEKIREEREKKYQRNMWIAHKFAVAAAVLVSLGAVYEASKSISNNIKPEQTKINHIKNDTTIHAAHYHAAPAPTVK